VAQLRVRAGGEGAPLSAHELERLTAPALARLLTGGISTVVVPFGSIEDQNGHLPMGADSLLADLVGAEVAARLDGVLAPTVRVGAPQHGLELLSVAPETLADTALALADGLASRGFRLVVLLPIHGANVAPLNKTVARFNERRGPVRPAATSARIPGATRVNGSPRSCSPSTPSL
jgi:creatinine amidohydrolase/Fe(II)-dependent formamide hydrolase-like protein